MARRRKLPSIAERVRYVWDWLPAGCDALEMMQAMYRAGAVDPESLRALEQLYLEICEALVLFSDLAGHAMPETRTTLSRLEISVVCLLDAIHHSETGAAVLRAP